MFETISEDKKLFQLEKLEKSYEYESEAIYSGSWLGGFRHGRGIMRWKDGTYYEGEWNLGFAEGNGMLVYLNGDFMKGQFMYNKLNGIGECINSEMGYNYKGKWENDLQSGQGNELWQDGSEYIGFYEFGKKNGFGKYNWIDGSNYIGDWKDNKINGLVFKSNNIGHLSLVRRKKIYWRLEKLKNEWIWIIFMERWEVL